MRRMRTYILGAGAGACGLLGFVLWAQTEGSGEMASEPTTVPAMTYGGAFELVDHTGKRVSDADYRGRYMLVYFGYTHCPDVCPTGLAVIATAMSQLGDAAAQVQPLFISVDSNRDTPERLAQYVTAFHPRLAGLSGTAKEVFAATRAYKVMYFATEIDGKYLVDHTAYTYLMGPDGEFLQRFGHGVTPAELATAIRSHLNARD
jgi:cytochrome oxidase Cu insertion factor (SCO1/SenC/PrrC family)